MKNHISLLAALVLFGSCQKSTKETEVINEDTTVEHVTLPEVTGDEDMCFLKVVSKDSIILNVVKKGDSVSGNFNWKPYEKDKKLMTYKGTIKNNTVTAVGVAMAEGMTNREELIFTLEGNKASVKFGEMKESDDGVWRYKDKKGAGVQVLDKVECE